MIVALGAGCDGDEPSPTTLPPSPSPTVPSAAPTTPSPTATPTPTPTAPTLPPAARADTPAGAEAFALFYVVALDYAYQAGDTRLLRELAKCRGCSSVADGIDKWTAAGGRYEGGRLKVIDSSIIKHVKGSAGLVSVTYSRTDRVLVSSTGTREAVAGDPSLTILMTERRTADGWLITEIQVVR
jgi:hypothetical protein